MPIATALLVGLSLEVIILVSFLSVTLSSFDSFGNVTGKFTYR